MHWQYQVHAYVQETGPQKETFLLWAETYHAPKCSDPVMELWAVKNQADQHKTHTGTTLTYEQYCNLLLSVASAYDDTFAAKEAILNPRTMLCMQMTSKILSFMMHKIGHSIRTHL